MNAGRRVGGPNRGYGVALVLALSGCAVPHAHVIYHAAQGAAMVCDVIAGVIQHCQETPTAEPGNDPTYNAK